MGGGGFSYWFVPATVPSDTTDDEQEGLLTMVVSIIAYFFIHNYPATASFLSEEERDVIQRRLKDDSDATVSPPLTLADMTGFSKDMSFCKIAF